MDGEPNYLPWKHYQDYYFLSKEDYDNIGSNSCFRVQCKLCMPALKTIGTNRSSSSNLRKHMKSIHPEVLEEMEKRLSMDGNNIKGKRKKDEQPVEPTWKRAKTDELLGGERELLFQLVEEYTAALECSPDDEINPRKRHLWRSLTSTFNEISGGLERTPEQLRIIWESLNGENKGSEEKGSGPRILTTCSMRTPKGDSESYSEGVAWETSVENVEGDNELDDISRPIIMTDENCTFEVSYQDDLGARQNVYKQGSNVKSADFKKRSEVELKLREQLVSDQRVRLGGLKQQMDLKKDLLKEELEHQRRMKRMEFVHRKILNSMERMMKQEAFRAEERRKEEKHAVEMSILRMSARLSPQMKLKTPTPGTFQNIVSSPGVRLDSQPLKCRQDDTDQPTDSPCSSLGIEKLAKASSMEKKLILLQPTQPNETYEIIQEEGNVTLQNIQEEVCVQVNVAEK